MMGGERDPVNGTLDDAGEIYKKKGKVTNWDMQKAYMHNVGPAFTKKNIEEGRKIMEEQSRGIWKELFDKTVDYIKEKVPLASSAWEYARKVGMDALNKLRGNPKKVEEERPER